MNPNLRLLLLLASMLILVFNDGRTQSERLYTLTVGLYYSFHPSKKPIAGIEVKLLNTKKESVCSGISDTLGLVFFDSSRIPKDFDTLFLEFFLNGEKLWMEADLVNPFQEDNKRSFNFIKEFVVNRGCFVNFDQFIVHAPIFSVDTFDGFQLNNLLSLLEFYPYLCILVSQTKHPEESDALAGERLSNFKLLIEKSGLPMHKIMFSTELRVLPESVLKTDARPRIEFSLGGFDCD